MKRQLYSAKFDNRLWRKMKALASLQGQKIDEWLDEAIEENIKSINIHYYNEDQNYKSKRFKLRKDLHQKVKNQAYIGEYHMRDIIQSVIEKEIEKAGL